jgi:predicted N-acetyltransferase YhbS
MSPERDGQSRIASMDDHDAIRRVNLPAFGGDDEANLVASLRDGGFLDVSLLAEADFGVSSCVSIKSVIISGSIN